jgi:dTDP-4-amino-4,6-dideoxygalactose transaminase
MSFAKATTRRVPFLDLRVDSEERAELMAAVEEVLSHGRIVLGPEVQALEHELAERCGRRYAVGVNSGTDALYLGLRSFGIGPGDEVITTALSWVATANAIALTGATPVFADIGQDLNVDPAGIEALVNARTKAIMPVHYTGKICDMRSIAEVAERHGLLVIEDASQAFDAAYRGRKAGSFGEIGCFSMNPMKVFAACGEAGLVVTDSEEVYDRLIALRYNGAVDRDLCMTPSHNGRLDTLQAAILLKRLPRVERLIERRRRIAARYTMKLGGVVETPLESEGQRDVYYTYTIKAHRRDELKEFLEAAGVETKIQHRYLMPEQPAYRGAPRGELANAHRLVKQILCLPAHEKMTIDQVDYVADRIHEFYEAKVHHVL